MNVQKRAWSFRTLFRVCQIFLRLSGISAVDPVFDSENAPSLRTSVAYFVWYVLGLFTTSFLVVCMFIKIFREASTDTYSAMETSNSAAAGILIVTRGLQLFLFRNKIKYLLGNLKVLWSGTTKTGMKKDIMIIAKWAALGTKIYAVTIGIAALLYMGPPFYKLLDHFVISDNTTLNLNTTGILADYPFPRDTLAAHIGTLLGECFAFIYNCSYCIASGSLYIQFIGHVSIQLKILGDDLTELGKKENTNIDETVLIKRINKTGRRHCELIGYCDMIKRIYNPVVFFNVSLTALNLYICGKLIYEEWSNSSYTKAAKYILHCLCFILIVIFDCAAAQMLINNSEAIADAAYKCDWQDHQKYLKRSTLLIMMMAQQGCNFNVYGFCKLDMSQISYIFNAAISYRALLQHVESKNST